MSRLPEEEFNFLVLHYLKRGRYAYLADSFEQSLLEDSVLPKRLRIDGSPAELDYAQLIARNGTLDPDVLLERLVWGVHEHRQFPAIEGPTVMPEPPAERALEEGVMDVDVKKLGVPLKRLSATQRLLHPHRGARLHKDINNAAMRATVDAFRVGITTLPFHLEKPLSIYPKFHQLARRRGHAMEVFYGMFDKTGTRLFTGSDDWLIKVWSTHSGLLVNTLRGHKGAITYMCIDPTNRYLASSSDDNSIRVWSLATYTNVAVLQNVHSKAVVELSWSPCPTGNVLVSMALDGFINAWEILPSTGKSSEIETLLGKDTMLKFRHSLIEPYNNSPCQSGPLSPCGTRALVSCKDGSVRILSLNPLRQIQRVVAHGANVPLAVWSNASANRFITACDDGTSKIYEYLNAERGWVLKHTMSVLEVVVPGPKPKMLGAKWSMNDDFIILSYQRTIGQNWNHLKVFDSNSGKLLGCLEGHTADVHSLSTHPTDHRILATAGYDQRIIIWNLYTLMPITILQLPNYEDEECPITEISWNPNGTQLVVTDIIGTFTLFGIGPTDSFKGPVEQFFSTDYHETTIDAAGFVVDNETQLPPHLTPRTPLCFRTGLVHPSPPVLPPLVDPRTQLNPVEVQEALERRTQLAEEEDANFGVGEPPAEGRVRTQASQVAPAAAPANASPAPPALNRARTQPPAGGVLASMGYGFTTQGRLRRNNETGSRSSTRNRRVSSNITRVTPADNDDDVILSEDDEDYRRALLDSLKDAEDFEVDGSESDVSISSDGDGGRPRDAHDEDLYWSGDEATAQFLSPAARRAGRELRGLGVSTRNGSSSRPRPTRNTRSNSSVAATPGSSNAAGGSTTRSSSNRPYVDYEDSDDEDYGAGRRKKRSQQHTPAANTRTRSNSNRNKTDEEDGLEAGSNASSDIPFFDTEDEEYKAEEAKRRDRSGRVKPPEYPSWVTQDSPSAIFCPQLGDELVFLQAGYARYIETFAKRLAPTPVPILPPNLPVACYCHVLDVQYESTPFIHARITLAAILSGLPQPYLLTDPSRDELCGVPQQIIEEEEEVGEDGEKKTKKKLKVRISTAAPGSAPNIPLDPRPFIPVREIASRNAAAAMAASSIDANGHMQLPMMMHFQVLYHGNAEAPDFLVLATRFNQGMAMPWYPNKRVSAWIASETNPNEGDDYPGTVLETHPESPWESVTILWEDDDSGAERMSPWELDAIDANGNRVPVFVESLSVNYRAHLVAAIEHYIKNNAELCEIFRLPVPLATWPSYLTVNPWPVHLKLILARLRSGWYRTLDALKRDIASIMANSMNFNGASQITENATIVSTSLMQIVSSINPEIQLVPKGSATNVIESPEDDEDSKRNRGRPRKGSSGPGNSSGVDDSTHKEEDEAGWAGATDNHASNRSNSRHLATPKKKKSSKKKRKRGTFGEVYESETTNSEDLLPYTPPVPLKKTSTIVDPSNFNPVHEENQAQRAADTAAEHAINASRQTHRPLHAPEALASSETVGSAPIAAEAEATPNSRSSAPRTRFRLRTGAAPESSPPTASSAPQEALPSPVTRRSTKANQNGTNSNAAQNATPTSIESSSGRPVRSTRAKTSFSNIDRSDDDRVFDEEEEEPMTNSRPRRR